MKSLTELWCRVCEDLAPLCDSSDVRADIAYARCRVEKEGFAFMALTLPAYATDFERSLELGCISSDLFRGFRRRGGLPAFLSGFLRRIFDTRGRLLTSPDPNAVRAVRQLTLLFKKVETDIAPEKARLAIDGYRKTDRQLGEVKLPLDPSLSVVFATLFGPMLNVLDRKISSFELVGRHGPGAVAEGLMGNEKFSILEWPESIDSVLPAVGSIVPSWRYGTEISFVSDEQVRPAKVVLVPKTFKGPRVIAEEPVCKQFAQQALWREIPPSLKYCPFPKIIGFSDQEVNRDLARKGSIDGSLATLDLSEASDRVHWDLVQYLFVDYPHILDYLEATRSSVSVLPDGSTVELNKFASMGSALCFPIEAMVFATIIAWSAQKAGFGNPLETGASIRVFGDDIIVPGEWNTSVVRDLEAFGLKVNENKSFSQGFFRESCGGDYFRGADVTPIRLKHLPTREHWRNATWLTNTASVQNRLFERGLYSAAAYLREWAERSTHCKLPAVNPWSAGSQFGNSVLCWYADEDLHTSRMNRGLQKPQVLTLVLRAPSHKAELDGLGALQKCLTADWSDPTSKGHLLRFGRGHDASMIRDWVG